MADYIERGPLLAWIEHVEETVQPVGLGKAYLDEFRRQILRQWPLRITNCEKCPFNDYGEECNAERG